MHGENFETGRPAGGRGPLIERTRIIKSLWVAAIIAAGCVNRAAQAADTLNKHAVVAQEGHAADIGRDVLAPAATPSMRPSPRPSHWR